MAKVNHNFDNLVPNYLFAEIAKRVNEYVAEHPDNHLIRLGIGDVTLPLAPAVVEAMKKGCDELGNKETFKGYPDYEGYAFLREAVKMVVECPDMINRITKELYPGIGKRFNTSASKVERAIRHAIEVAWSRGRIDTLNKAFGCRVATREDKPTNGEFIAMIADKMALEQRNAS